jgi:hypothetical protein
MFIILHSRKVGTIKKNANCVKFWIVKIIVLDKIFALRMKKVSYSVLTLRNCKENSKKAQRSHKETAKKPQRNRKETAKTAKKPQRPQRYHKETAKVQQRNCKHIVKKQQKNCDETALKSKDQRLIEYRKNIIKEN